MAAFEMNHSQNEAAKREGKCAVDIRIGGNRGKVRDKNIE